jgi:hypothetical protein
MSLLLIKDVCFHIHIIFSVEVLSTSLLNITCLFHYIGLYFYHNNRLSMAVYI